jgi:hypothetical protein
MSLSEEFLNRPQPPTPFPSPAERSLIEVIALLSTEVFILSQALKANTAVLQQIADALNRNPNGFSIKETAIGETMSMSKKLGVDLQLLDDGKGVRYVLTPTKNGTPVSLPDGTPAPAMSVVDSSGAASSAFSLAPTAGDTTNLSFDGTLATPPVDGTGIVAKFVYTFPDGDVLEGDAPAVDIVPDPKATEPDSFVFQETAL